MIAIELHHRMHADAGTYWRDFFDTATAHDFFTRGLGFRQFDVTHYDEDDVTIRRIARCHAMVDLPRPVAAVLGHGFRYVEDGVFDKPTGRWDFAWIPSLFPERIAIEGWTTATTLPGGDACERRAEMRVTARFPAIGGVLERQTARFLRGEWDRSARVNNEWLDRRRIEGTY